MCTLGEANWEISMYIVFCMGTKTSLFLKKASVWINKT